MGSILQPYSEMFCAKWWEQMFPRDIFIFTDIITAMNLSAATVCIIFFLLSTSVSLISSTYSLR
jgi:hypothetical protein